MKAGMNSQQSLTARGITLPFTGYFLVIAHFKSERFLDNTHKDYFCKMTSLANDLDETFACICSTHFLSYSVTKFLLPAGEFLCAYP